MKAARQDTGRIGIFDRHVIRWLAQVADGEWRLGGIALESPVGALPPGLAAGLTRRRKRGRGRENV